MEHRGRCGRRGRGCCYADFLTNQSNACSLNSKFWSFLNGIYNIVITSSLIAIIYLMLEYHYSTCMTKHELHNVTRNIESIAKNIVVMKIDYRDLENKISKFSQELPRLEGQIEILEALSKSVQKKNSKRGPKLHYMPFGVSKADYEHRDEFNKLENVTGKVCSNLCPQILANQA